MTEHLHTTDPEADSFQLHTLPDDLPEESAAAVASSLVQVAREVVGADISVTRERLPCGDVNISGFVVTLPAGLTGEERGAGLLAPGGQREPPVRGGVTAKQIWGPAGARAVAPAPGLLRGAGHPKHRVFP